MPERAKSMAAPVQTNELQKSLSSKLVDQINQETKKITDNQKDYQVMITKYSLIIFLIETSFDAENQFEVKRHDNEDAGDVRLERLEEIEKKRYIQVTDVQRFNFMDFEFMQKM